MEDCLDNEYALAMYLVRMHDYIAVAACFYLVRVTICKYALHCFWMTLTFSEKI